VLAAVVVHVGHAAASSAAPAPSSSAAPGSTAAQVIAYARAQEGCPYVWGGTGPCQAGYDCSGLPMEAYASAGVTIERTSQAQWASEPQVADPQPGDLVFFVGADGTWSAPGHVGIVVDPAEHLMIDAYGSGYDVQEQTYGLPTSWEGLADPVGFTDPLAGRSS
jgi:cell wall-associated NlpC family hydrolase